MKVSRGSIYLRGNRWWYQMTLDGELVQKPLGTSIKMEALKIFAEMKEGILQGINPAVYEALTFSSLWDKYRKVALPSKTAETAKREIGFAKRLLAHFGPLSLIRISPEDVDGFINHCLAEGLKPGSVNRYVTLLAAILHRAVEWGYLKKSPVRRSRPLKTQPKTIPYLSNDQIIQILEHASPFYRVVIIALLETGARVGEVSRIRWKDVDFGKGLVTLRAEKTYDIRTVRLTVRLATELQGFSREGETVFPRHVDRIKNNVIDICKRADCPGVSSHVFRHTYISRLVASGMDLRSVMALSGHKRLATLQRYAHLAPGFMAGVDERLGYKY